MYLFLTLTLVFQVTAQPAETPRAAHARVVADRFTGKPLVAHVVVALRDNRYQGIVPVPKQLGNGQDSCNNLYWDAHGVKTFLVKAGWRILQSRKMPDPRIPGILERIILHARLDRTDASWSPMPGRVVDLELQNEASTGLISSRNRNRPSGLTLSPDSPYHKRVQ